MVVGDGHERAALACLRHAEGVARALDDQDRQLDGVELRLAALGGVVGAARRVHREGETQDGAASVAAAVRHATRAPAERPPHTSRSPASSSSRRRSTTAVQALSSCAAGGDERRPATTIGLLDEGDAEPLLERGATRGHEVGRGHAAAGAVAEHERARPPAGGLEVDARRALRSIDVDRAWVTAVHAYTAGLTSSALELDHECAHPQESRSRA